MDFRELYRIMDEEENITDDVVNILKELDVLPSVTTQASLNKMLVAVHDRLLNGEKVVISGKTMTVNDFNMWVHNTFEAYSANMYKNTIK